MEERYMTLESRDRMIKRFAFSAMEPDYINAVFGINVDEIYENNISKINFSDNVLNNLDICEMCSVKLSNSNICQFNCGHIYCSDCVDKKIYKLNKCPNPNCNTKITNYFIS